MVKKSSLGYVTYGYGQIEPNHLSAQRTGQIYAQLPVDKAITLLENGQFVKYDYATGCVNKSGKGEWMLVYNEVKTYYDNEPDCYFAMKAENYNARVYAPNSTTGETARTVNYSTFAQEGIALDGTTDPMKIAVESGPIAFDTTKTGTMVPRVFKTNVGDIFTTNTIKDAVLEAGDVLKIDTDGYLNTEGTGDMAWEVVKVYTMPDGQKGVKIMRIA